MLKHLDSAGRIAEQNHLVLIANAQRREQLKLLEEQSWIVWEPGCQEILGANPSISPTGITGLDSSILAAGSEARGRVRFHSCADAALAEAFVALGELGRLLDDHALDDPGTQEILERLEELYFTAAGWMRVPSGAEFTIAREIGRQIGGGDRQYLARFAGESVAGALNRFVVSLESFIDAKGPGSSTPKGSALLAEVRALQEAHGRGGIVVTAHLRARTEMEAYLRENDLDVPCIVARERRQAPAEGSILVSVLWRDAFAHAVDPWPARDVIVVGYRQEVDAYTPRMPRARRRNLGSLPAHLPRIEVLVVRRRQTVPSARVLPAPIARQGEPRRGANRPRPATN